MSKPDPNRHVPRDNDAYVAAQASGFPATLKQLRAVVNAATPDCTECVSYRIPFFRLRKDFVALSAAKRQSGPHNMSKAIPAEMREKLEAAGISTSGTTLEFEPGIDLPVPLVEIVLRARLSDVNGV